LFYVVLYAFLAAFFAAMLMVFFQTLDLYQPRWQNANGLIGTNPGKISKTFSVKNDFPTVWSSGAS
jgi:hypothetical protein